jgi:alpha-galactosidase
VLRHILKAGFYKDLKDSGEEYINQMLAILGKTKFVTNVNIPNVGQHDGIPLGAVVETNAHFSSAGVKPVYSGALPPLVNQLVMRHVTNQEALVKAVRTKNEDLAFSAFVNDPLTSRIALDDAWKLFKTMVKKTKFSFK